MLHMLSCFNLKPQFDLSEFERSLDEFTTHMRSLDLIVDRGPIGRRVTDTILDTDSERSHRYFMLMQFRDRAQADKAVDYIQSHIEPGDSIHSNVYQKADDMIFICWQDTRPAEPETQPQ